MKKCPDCAELVLADARICRFCRHEFLAAPGIITADVVPPAEGEAVRQPWSVMGSTIVLDPGTWAPVYGPSGRFRCEASVSSRWFLSDAVGVVFQLEARAGGVQVTRPEVGGGGQLDTAEYAWWTEQQHPSLVVLVEPARGPTAVFTRLAD